MSQIQPNILILQKTKQTHTPKHTQVKLSLPGFDSFFQSPQCTKERHSQRLCLSSG